MKTIKYILIVTVILLTGCQKDFLEKENPNQATPEQYWKDAASVQQTITTCYAPIKYNELFGITFQFVFFAMDPYILNEGGDYPKYKAMAFFADDSRVAGMYRTLYTGVNRCNLAIEKIPTVPGVINRNRYMGEAFFLRALYYYYLTTLFNEPPLVTKFLDKFEDYNALKNSPQDSLLARIITDLDSAIAYLPVNSAYPNTDKGRATKGAAYALLGKTYIWKHEWQKAADAFSEIINQRAGTYELIMPKAPYDSLDYVYAYLCNFSIGSLTNGANIYPAENNNESVFEIQNASFQSDQWNEMLDGYGTDGSMITSFFSLYGWNNIAADAAFLNTFEKPLPETKLQKDPRLYSSAYTGDTVRCWTGAEYPADFKKLCNKVAIPSLRIPNSMPLKKYMFPIYCGTNESHRTDPNNWRLIRYSDVLLLYAEAQYHLGNVSEAFDKLNQVRRRAGMPDATGDFKTALIKERQFEFCFEGSLYLDLVRWHMVTDGGGRFIDIQKYVPNFTFLKNEYLPIPRFEIDYMNGTLVQNQGW